MIDVGLERAGVRLTVRAPDAMTGLVAQLRHVKLRSSSSRDRPRAPSVVGSASRGYEDKRESDLDEFGAARVTLPLPVQRLVFVRLVAALPATLDPRRIAVQLHEDVVRHLHGGETAGGVRGGGPGSGSRRSSVRR